MGPLSRLLLCVADQLDTSSRPNTTGGRAAPWTLVGDGAPGEELRVRSHSSGSSYARHQALS
jgi:hypothetical protein